MEKYRQVSLRVSYKYRNSNIFTQAWELELLKFCPTHEDRFKNSEMELLQVRSEKFWCMLRAKKPILGIKLEILLDIHPEYIEYTFVQCSKASFEPLKLGFPQFSSVFLIFLSRGPQKKKSAPAATLHSPEIDLYVYTPKHFFVRPPIQNSKLT